MKIPADTTDTAVIYCRISALDSQSDVTESLDNQARTLTAAAHAAGYVNVIEVVERHTGSKKQPGLEDALTMLDGGQAVALFATKIDRLSRSGALDVIRIADRAERKGWRLVVLDVGMDTSTMVGRLVLTILAGVAEMESRRRSERMREFHAGRRAIGAVAGATYGARTTASSSTCSLIAQLRSAGHTWQSITDELNRTAADGRKWYPTSAKRAHHSAQRLAAHAA